MNTAVDYLESLGAFDLDETSLNRFISLLEREQNEDAKKAAVEFLLHVVSPSLDLTEKFIHSRLIRESKDLQESVKVFVSNRKVKAQQLNSSDEYSWNLLAAEILNL